MRRCAAGVTVGIDLDAGPGAWGAWRAGAIGGAAWVTDGCVVAGEGSLVGGATTGAMVASRVAASAGSPGVEGSPGWDGSEVGADVEGGPAFAGGVDAGCGLVGVSAGFVPVTVGEGLGPVTEGEGLGPVVVAGDVGLGAVVVAGFGPVVVSDGDVGFGSVPADGPVTVGSELDGRTELVVGECSAAGVVVGRVVGVD